MNRPASTPDPRIGQLVSGRYRIDRVLGEGGMGTVYSAMHETIEKRVALKVLHKEYSAHAEVIERFKREAVSASRIKHPNVIDVFDFGQLDDGCFFIAMEFLEGKDLGDTLTRVGSFAPPDAVSIILQVCRALHAAHVSGVVHRDLKPENVFLQSTPDGEQIVKLVDFGIAQLRQAEEAGGSGERKRRLTKTGMIFGTPEYMAPEQARGTEVDERADIYAAGIILYELLAGGVPFTGQSFLDVLNHHVLTPVPAIRSVKPTLEVSLELETALLRALEKKPTDRFATVKEFIEALQKTPEAMRVAGAPVGLPSSPMQPVVEPPTQHTTAMLGTARPTPLSGSHTVGEIDYQVPKSGSFFGGYLLGAVGILLLVGGGIFLVRGRGGGEPTPAPTTAPSEALSVSRVEPPLPQLEVPAPADSVAAEPVASAAPPNEPAASDEVTLHVETVPAGAIIRREGAQVCDQSPCDVSAKKGSEVRLSAIFGKKTAAARVLAQTDQKVVMTLVAPKGTSTPKTGGSGDRLCEVTIDGLKILRPCQ